MSQGGKLIISKEQEEWNLYVYLASVSILRELLNEGIRYDLLAKLNILNARKMGCTVVALID